MSVADTGRLPLLSPQPPGSAAGQIPMPNSMEPRPGKSDDT